MLAGYEGETLLLERARLLVAQFWADERKALLLSALGIQLRRDFPEAMSQLRSGLQKLIEGSTDLKIVRHPQFSQKIGVVPAEVDVATDTKPLFSERLEPKRPRLDREFWEAFHRPLLDRRFALFREGGPVRILDAAEAPREGSSVYEILKTDIVSPEPVLLQEKISATWGKVDAWLKRNSLDVAAVTATDRPAPRAYREHMPSAGFANELALALSQLSSEDQSRIAIPLDIVAKLLKSR